MLCVFKIQAIDTVQHTLGTDRICVCNWLDNLVIWCHIGKGGGVGNQQIYHGPLWQTKAKLYCMHLWDLWFIEKRKSCSSLKYQNISKTWLEYDGWFEFPRTIDTVHSHINVVKLQGTNVFATKHPAMHVSTFRQGAWAWDNNYILS